MAVTVATATKDAPFINTLGMKFVPVPITGGPTAGQRVLFSVWETRVQDYAAYAAAQEVAGRKVNDAWKAPKREGVPLGQGPDHPAVNVSWEDAQAFCAWLTEIEQAAGRLAQGLRYRLPSDHEWSCAVGVGDREDAAQTPEQKSRKIADLPWGAVWPPRVGAGNFADEAFHAKFPVRRNEEQNRDENQWIQGYDDGYAATAPVGSFLANAHGLHDLSGNVWEWCEELVKPGDTPRVLRGGSFGSVERDFLLSSCRGDVVPAGRCDYIGFRVVVVGASSGR